jgi:hypothetical protein
VNAIVIPKAARMAELAAIIAAQLDGGSLRLFQNDIQIDEDTVLADFLVATFSGYANKTIAAWGDPFLDWQEVATTLTPLQTFAANASTVQNICYGLYYVTAGGALAFAVRFSQPWNFAQAGDTKNIVLRYQSGQITVTP